VTLYEILGLKKTAADHQVKAAYRRLSAFWHPDNRETGDPDKFHEVKHAYDILSNPDRRERYDRTGRDDDLKVTPRVIQNMVEQTVIAMVNAERPDGTTDDPTWENVRDKILKTIREGRREPQANLKRQRKKLARLDNLAKRFRSKTDSDPIGDAFAAQRRKMLAEIYKWEDGLELSYKTEEVFSQYDYVTGEVGPEPEGQFSPGPTARLSGPRLLLTDRCFGGS
jgi:curved DNA-binding protein CbpA